MENIEKFAIYTMGEVYPVIKANGKYLITREHNSNFSGEWEFLGVIPRLKGIRNIIGPNEALNITDWKFKNGTPRYCVVDKDHGSVRVWRGTNDSSQLLSFGKTNDGFWNIISNNDIKLNESKNSLTESKDDYWITEFNKLKQAYNPYKEDSDEIKAKVKELLINAPNGLKMYRVNKDTTSGWTSHGGYTDERTVKKLYSKENDMWTMYGSKKNDIDDAVLGILFNDGLFMTEEEANNEVNKQKVNDKSYHRDIVNVGTDSAGNPVGKSTNRVTSINENKNIEESKKYAVYATYGGDGVYNSKLVDTVDSEEQAADRVAELQATGVGASYEEIVLEEVEKLNENKKYIVCSYYDEKLRGLEDDLYTNNWNDVEEFAHRKLIQGNIIEIENTKTGKYKRINPDKYNEEFNGEFIVRPEELEENKKIESKVNHIEDDWNKLQKDPMINAKEHWSDAYYSEVIEYGKSLNEECSQASGVASGVNGKIDSFPINPKEMEKQRLKESTETQMIITVESGLNADGFDITIEEGDKEVFNKSYRYGYDASYSKEHADSARYNYEQAIKYNWEDADLYYNLKPYTQDIIEDLMKKYHITKNNIIVTNGKNVFKGEPVSDDNVNKFINKYIEPIKESKLIDETLKESEDKDIILNFINQCINSGKFNKEQINEIKYGFEDGLTLEQLKIYANPKFDNYQMYEIRWGFKDGLTLEQVKTYADSKISDSEMWNIREKLEGNYEKEDDSLFKALEELIAYLNKNTKYNWDANEMYDNCAITESDTDYIEVFVDIKDGNKIYTVDNYSYNSLEELVKNMPVLFTDEDEDYDYDSNWEDDLEETYNKLTELNDYNTDGKYVITYGRGDSIFFNSLEDAKAWQVKNIWNDDYANYQIEDPEDEDNPVRYDWEDIREETDGNYLYEFVMYDKNGNKYDTDTTDGAGWFIQPNFINEL